VLVAWGFTEAGERVLLAVMLGMRESHDDRLALGRDLIARGLGAPLLIAADGAPGRSTPSSSAGPPPTANTAPFTACAIGTTQPAQWPRPPLDRSNGKVRRVLCSAERAAPKRSARAPRAVPRSVSRQGGTTKESSGRGFSAW
jgi:hypothetical protein